MMEFHFFSTTLKAIHPYLVVMSVHFSPMLVMRATFADKLHAKLSASDYAVALVEVVFTYHSPAVIPLDFQSAFHVPGMLAIVKAVITSSMVVIITISLIRTVFPMPSASYDVALMIN
jgi:hypothetical protein